MSVQAVIAAIRNKLTALTTSIAAAVDNTAYNEASWNGVTTIAPSKNAVRDEMETIKTSITTAVNSVIDSAPGALDTLNELAAAMGDDANFATTVTTSLAAKANKAWTVVESADATVAPTAADSGKYYRLTSGGATFRLPTTGLVVGETEFWLTFSDASGGLVHPQGLNLDHMTNDAGNFDPNVVTTSRNAYGCRLFHFKYVRANTWASDVIGPV